MSIRDDPRPQDGFFRLHSQKCKKQKCDVFYHNVPDDPFMLPELLLIIIAFMQKGKHFSVSPDTIRFVPG